MVEISLQFITTSTPREVDFRIGKVLYTYGGSDFNIRRTGIIAEKYSEKKALAFIIKHCEYVLKKEDGKPPEKLGGE